MSRGPCQPRGHKFSKTHFGNSSCGFKSEWFDEFGNWLEYNIEKDVVLFMLLTCYLMRVDVGEQQTVCEFFISEGFSNWKKKTEFGFM